MKLLKPSTPAQPKPAFRRAISYIRFSSPRQELGTSLERQLAGTKDFCKRHNLFLDETIEELKTSGYKGKNLAVGKLKIFIAAVEAKKIPPGTVLVVESLDRLTRNSVLEATNLLTTILTNGVDIGLVTEDKIYSHEYVNKNPFELIVAVTYLIRGGDESRRKSYNTTKNWKLKMEWVANEKRPVALNPPCWLVYKNHGKGTLGWWELDEAKVELIKKVYSDYLKSGLGIWQLTHQMNENKVPVITKRGRPDSKWHRITLHRLLTDKAVIGIYTNLEPPIEKYFPAIIDEDTFYAVQSKLKSRIRARGRSNLRDISLFKGICKCSRCGSTMTRITRTRKGKLEYRYLYCHGSILGTCKPARRVDLTKFENAFMRYTFGSKTANVFFKEEKEPDNTLPKEIAAVDGQILDKTARRDRLVESIEDGEDNPKVIKDRIAALENEVEQLRAKKDSLLGELNKTENFEDDVMEFVTSKPVLDKLDSPDRLRLRELIRKFVVSMVVNPFEKTATFTTIAGKTREMTW
jgi:hypothetical protein